MPCCCVAAVTPATVRGGGGEGSPPVHGDSLAKWPLPPGQGIWGDERCAERPAAGSLTAAPAWWPPRAPQSPNNFECVMQGRRVRRILRAAPAARAHPPPPPFAPPGTGRVGGGCSATRAGTTRSGRLCRRVRVSASAARSRWSRRLVVGGGARAFPLLPPSAVSVGAAAGRARRPSPRPTIPRGSLDSPPP